MKLISPAHILSDQLWQLHCLESQVARALPVLSGSVLNSRLRGLLTGRARCARERHDILEDLIKHHGHPTATKTLDAVRGILAEGERELSRIHHPCVRDVAMIEHCIRIEQHATTAYGIAVPLAHRIGFSLISEKLRLLLGDLESARPSFQSVEAEVFAIAASHHPICGGTPRLPASVRARDQLICEGVKQLDVAC
ncbi:MAG: DUF892 family protein [Verrucomicrobiota bacterium]